MVARINHERFCSFCGKESQEVFALIAGPQVFICDECVEACTSIIAEKRIEKAVADTLPAVSQPNS